MSHCKEKETKYSIGLSLDTPVMNSLTLHSIQDYSNYMFYQSSVTSFSHQRIDMFINHRFSGK